MNRTLSTFKDAEQFVKINYFTRRGFDIHGIIQVGTNDWYEYQRYVDMGIEYLIGFEPLSEPVRRFNEKNTDGIIFPYGLSDKEEAIMVRVASGDSQSSTIYQLEEDYQKNNPNLQFVDTQVCYFLRFDEFVEKYSIPIEQFDCLVVDVEGMEKRVLEGFGKYLEGFKYLNIECSGVRRFVGGPTAQEMIEYLDLKGFVQQTPIEPDNDIMFLRKDLV